MTVDIGDGRSDTIIVHADDEFEDLASQFQKKHDLSVDVLAPLAEYIRSNVNELSAKNQQSTMNRSNNLMNQTDLGATHRSTTTALNDSFDDNNYRSSHIPTSEVKKSEDVNKSATKKKNEKITAGLPYFTKPVFDRLHETAKHKEAKLLQAKIESEMYEKQKIDETKVPMSSTSKRIIGELDRSRNTIQRYSNYGEFLYSEAKTMKEKQDEMIEQQKRLNEAKQGVEATFQPRINNSFKFIMNNNKDILERVMEKSVRRPKAPMMESQVDTTFTYRPKISRTSERLAKEKKIRESVVFDDFHFKEEDDLHEQLFKDAELRLKKKQESLCYLPSEATFKPEIGKHSFIRGEDKNEFINRLVNSKKETDKHVAQLRTQMYSNIDQETGRELFKPVISRYPSTSKFKQEGFVDNPKSKMIQEYEESIKKMANQSHTNQNSQKLVEIAKIRKITELFEFLDSDHDGYINIRAIVSDVKYLEPELIQELQFVFKQFEENTVISLDEFVNHMLARVEDTRLQGAKITLLTSFSRKNAEIKKKRMVLETKTEIDPTDLQIIDENYTFKPRLNRHSEELVNMSQERRRALSAGRIHEVLLGEKEKWRIKKEIRKEELLQDELAQCTFQPDTRKSIQKKSRPSSPENQRIEQSNIEELTNRLLQAKKNKLATVSRNSEQRELQEYCSFTPKINKTRSSHSRSQSISVHPQHDVSGSYSQLYIGRGSKLEQNGGLPV